MKYLFVVLVFGIGVNAVVEKPGSCPIKPTEISSETLQECSSDFSCLGSEKCCDGACAQTVCDDVENASECSENPCGNATCSEVPMAVCFPNPCSTNCSAVWMTPFRDVTDRCDGSDGSDDETAGRGKWSKKRKMFWMKKKCARISRRRHGNQPRWCANKGGDAANWEGKLKRKWEKKKEHAMGKFTDKRRGRWQKKLEKKRLRKERRQEKKQTVMKMTAEEREEFLAGKRQKMLDKLEALEDKTHPKKSKLEKKLAKIERKRVGLQ